MLNNILEGTSTGSSLLVVPGCPSLVLVVVTALVSEDQMKAEDRHDAPAGNYVVEVEGALDAEEAVEAALDCFHEHIGIARLDDFSIEAEVVACDDHRLEEARDLGETEAQRIPDRFIVADSWDHASAGCKGIFRWVWDRHAAMLAALQVADGSQWRMPNRQEAAAIDGSLRNANHDSIADPAPHGLAEATDLPAWAQQQRDALAAGTANRA